MWVQSLGHEDPLEVGMMTHSSILAWRNPWTEKPRLHSQGVIWVKPLIMQAHTQPSMLFGANCHLFPQSGQRWACDPDECVIQTIGKGRGLKVSGSQTANMGTKHSVSNLCRESSACRNRDLKPVHLRPQDRCRAGDSWWPERQSPWSQRWNMKLGPIQPPQSGAVISPYYPQLWPDKPPVFPATSLSLPTQSWEASSSLDLVHLAPSGHQDHAPFHPCIQFSSVTQSYLTLCDPMDCGNSSSGFPVHYQLQELAQTHVHRVGDAIQPSPPLLAPSPPALSLSQHQSLF